MISIGSLIVSINSLLCLSSDILKSKWLRRQVKLSSSLTGGTSASSKESFGLYCVEVVPFLQMLNEWYLLVLIVISDHPYHLLNRFIKIGSSPFKKVTATASSANWNQLRGRKPLNRWYPKLVNFSSLIHCIKVFMIILKIKGKNESPWRTTFSFSLKSTAIYLVWKSFVIIDKRKSLYKILTMQ